MDMNVLLLCGFMLGLASVVTDKGRDITTNRVKGAGTEPVYVAWGTGAGTAGVTDTTLFTEASEARVAGSSSRQTTAVANDTYRVVGTMTADGSKTITNAGLFDASTSGNLYCKGDFTGIVLAANDTIAFTFNVQYA